MATVFFLLCAACVVGALFAWLFSHEINYPKEKEGLSVKWLIAAVIFAVLSLTTCVEDAQAHHAPLEYYTAQQVVADMHWAYNDLSETDHSLAKYKDEIFCQDPYRFSYIVWLILTDEVREEVKAAIFNAMAEADELYCLKIS